MKQPRIGWTVVQDEPERTSRRGVVWAVDAGATTMESEVRGPARERIPVDVARRIALAGQGFTDLRPSGRVDARHVRRVIDRVGVLQMDSVNVLCRSHYLPLFARLGPYPRQLLDGMAWGDQGRGLFEYWGHKASMLPLGTWPLLRWRMQAVEGQAWGGTLQPGVEVPWAVIAGMTRLARERPALVDEVLAVVAERGPVSAREASPDGQRRSASDPDPDPSTGRMWNWQDAKIALEWLFFSGKVTIAARRNFERLYDLTERVIPADVLAAPAPSAEEAQRELIRIAARAHGIATERQLREYFTFPAEHSKARVAELVDAGELIPVRVEGLPQRMYLWSEARVPSQVRARALLSPFDSLIWDRDRALRLFDFHYRISVYTPAAQRTHGYYVMPFLLGDRLVARVDLKADRKQSTLLVQAAHAEPDVRETEVVAELADELRLMASWLELDRVVVNGRGDLAPALSRSVDAGS